MTATTRQQIYFAAVFIVINLLLLYWAVPEATYLQGGDAALYMGPAKALIELGHFASSPETPALPLSFAPPLYPLFLALPIGLLPWKAALVAVVILQAIMLWATAWLTRSLVPDRYAKGRSTVQGLVLFNPNALITVHLVQTESLFTLLAVSMLVCLQTVIRMPRMRPAVLGGLLLGLAALTRPTALYAIPVLLVLLPILVLFLPGGNAIWRRTAIMGLVIGLTAAVTVSPWFMRNALLFDRLIYTTNSGFYFADQYVELLQVGQNLSTQEASDLRYNRIADYAKAAGVVDPDALPAPERSELYRRATAPLLLAEPVSAHLKALARSWANLYIGGGASNIKNYLGLQGETLMQFMQTQPWRGVTGTLHDFFAKGYATYLALVGLTLAFTIPFRLLGVAGIVALWTGRDRATVLLFVGYLGFFTAQYLYLGQSRFRIPLEPVLMILATVGLLDLAEKWRRLRGGAA